MWRYNNINHLLTTEIDQQPSMQSFNPKDVTAIYFASLGTCKKFSNELFVISFTLTNIW
jgi:hypothetical protein